MLKRVDETINSLFILRGGINMGYLLSVAYEPKTNREFIKKDKEITDVLYQKDTLYRKLNAARRAGDINRVKKLDAELVRVYQFSKNLHQ